MKIDGCKSEEYYQKALALYREINVKDENLRNLLKIVAHYYSNQNRFEESKLHYKQCIQEFKILNEVSPELGKVYFSLGNLYFIY